MTTLPDLNEAYETALSVARISAVATIVAAYVNQPDARGRPLANIIEEARQGMGDLQIINAVAPVELIPAVPVKQSVKPDFITCLDDGKKFKSLKRHLASLGMTPDEYRAKWGLPADYPMVAPNYSATRSQLAKANGLGTKK